MFYSTPHKTFLLACGLALGCLFACGDSDNGDNGDNGENNNEINNDDPPGMSAEEEACLYAREDHPLDRSATLERSDAIDDIAQTHTHFRIALAAIDDDTNGGHVTYDVDEDARYGLFTSSDMTVVFLDNLGNELVSDSRAVDECPEIMMEHSIELESGEHFIRFGPTSEDEIFTVSEVLSEFD